MIIIYRHKETLQCRLFADICSIVQQMFDFYENGDAEKKIKKYE